MACDHGIVRAGKCNVPLEDGCPQLLVAAGLSQPLELIVQIEHENGGSKLPSRSARVGMKADNEEGFASDTQREVRVLGIGRDALIPLMPEDGIMVAQRLHASP